MKRTAWPLGLLLASATAQADFQVSAYSQTAGYQQILNKDFEAARQAAFLSPSVESRYAVSTNLCIAELMAGEPQAALMACDKAVKALPSASNPVFNLRARRRAMATVLSNRGVVHAVLGHTELAERDFRKANDLNRKLTIAADNLQYLKQEAAPVIVALN